MLFHLDEKVFGKFIDDMSKKIKIDADIIEKDYYVCTILKELAEKQDYLKAYFKGGTAVYKILDSMNRFSEDIDLTVEVVKEESNNSNKTRLKKSALGYKISGLELQKIEATSFTVSEPTELHTIEPILYKYANENVYGFIKTFI